MYSSLALNGGHAMIDQKKGVEVHGSARHTAALAPVRRNQVS